MAPHEPAETPEDENPSATPQVEVESLAVRYAGQDQWVLGEVKLTHLAGRVTAIVGPSGCGKTTLVRTICGLIPHCLPSEYAGSVRLEGQEIADATVQFLAENVAYVGQNPDAAVVTRSVFDDIAFPLQNLCVPAAEIEARVVEAARVVGLAERLWDDPWRLSGGQRQRLAIAAAAVMRPRLLVLDEPTSTIDTRGRVEFYELVARMVADGTGVVLIDHDLDPVLPICDQVIALNAAGELIASGTPREVFFGHASALAACGIWLPRAVRSHDAAVAVWSREETATICRFRRISLSGEAARRALRFGANPRRVEHSLSRGLGEVSPRDVSNSLGGSQVHGLDGEEGANPRRVEHSLSRGLGEVSPRDVRFDFRTSLPPQPRFEGCSFRSEDSQGMANEISSEPALTCAEAGIELPQLGDLCGEQVSYWRKTGSDWERVPGFSYVSGANTDASSDIRRYDQNRTTYDSEPLVRLEDFAVPKRSPAINLELGGGEFVAIVGPNGSGKTSLLSALAGLVRFRATHAQIAGKPPARGRHRVGYVFQNPEHQMVASTVEKELRVGGVATETVEHLLESFHLTKVRTQHPLTLSGGQLRRLSVATMVAEKRQVIVLDEPTYGQDWANTCELMDFIERRRAEGRSVIMATHDLELALEHCTHIVALPMPPTPAAVPGTAEPKPVTEAATESVVEPTETAATASGNPADPSEFGKAENPSEAAESGSHLMNPSVPTAPASIEPGGSGITPDESTGTTPVGSREVGNSNEVAGFGSRLMNPASAVNPAEPQRPRPKHKPGLFSSFNPLTLFIGLLPIIVSIFLWRNLTLNFIMMGVASLACLVARAPRGRTIASIIAPWLVTGVLFLSLSQHGTMDALNQVYNYGNAPLAATGVGVMLALVLVSGINTDPQKLLVTLSATFKVPYRITSAGTAAVAFVARFMQDFRLLRTAKALRGVGSRLGPLGPAVRWVASVVPLTILAVQHGERVALSMDSRGFGARPRRTELVSVPWRVRDWVLMLALWGACVALWVWL